MDDFIIQIRIASRLLTVFYPIQVFHGVSKRLGNCRDQHVIIHYVIVILPDNFNEFSFLPHTSDRNIAPM